MHFRREKYVPKGGPDGGDGGRGGDVVVVADENIPNLVEFNYQKRFVAQEGERGKGKKMHGEDRERVVVRVPVGTVVYEIPRVYMEVNLRERAQLDKLLSIRKLLTDMTEQGQEYIAAYGGRGGRGNDHFKSPTNQTPREAEKGQVGEEKYLMLELKIAAEVGIIGLPNVGKSSLLKALTRANPKIAGYPFTTLEPNLGVLKRGEQSLVLVDVPGVVESAWEGKGIGPWFLRHLERCNKLIHLLAPDSTRSDFEGYGQQMASDYRVVRKELEKYGRGLADKPEVVVVNKGELIGEEEKEKVKKELEKEIGGAVVMVSVAMREGLSGLVEALG